MSLVSLIHNTLTECQCLFSAADGLYVGMDVAVKLPPLLAQSGNINREANDFGNPSDVSPAQPLG